ncbi:SLC13 family permease [Liquorilactobacillus vini]|nr:SLC13 family permease [Liquorilactobacillus vini]
MKKIFGKGFMEIVKKIVQDKILWTAAAIASLSLIISRPQASDLDWQTIFSLAALMAVIQVFEKLNLLSNGAAYLISRASNQRTLMQLLLVLTFIGSMFLTNDVSILTIVPLFAIIAKQLEIKPVLPVVLINLAANLGSLVTPIGNPQNLFLLKYYQLTLLDFVKLAGPITLFSLLLLGSWSCKFAKTSVSAPQIFKSKLPGVKLWLTVILTVPILLGILGLLSSWVMLLLALILLIVIDYRLLAKIDYGLLLTFICFFIAVGDLSRAELVRRSLDALLNSSVAVYLTSLGISQLISNVPAAILLAPFSHAVQALFLGVNLGGLGTLIASLANLLAYKQYLLNFKKKSDNYLLIFTKINLISLAFLGIIGYFLIK